MKKKTSLKVLGLALSAVLCAGSTGMGGPTHVQIQISSLVGKPISLDFQLWDNSGVVGDSWVLIDNVVLGSGTPIDFEGGDLDGFVVDPTVNIVPGSIDGTGALVLRMNEDPSLWPVIVYRDYAGSDATTLSFDFDMTASDTVGAWGLDEFQMNVLDMNLSGRDIWWAVTANADGIVTSQETTATVIPAPGALVLGLIGFGTAGLWRRFSHIARREKLLK
jgi:hypothetical protein